MKCPAKVYVASARPYRGIGAPQYPFHDKTVVITNCGRLCLYRKKINLSTCLAGQPVGIKKSKTASGSSALWITTSVTSISCGATCNTFCHTASVRIRQTGTVQRALL
jgi:hypothetical protein